MSRARQSPFGITSRFLRVAAIAVCVFAFSASIASAQAVRVNPSSAPGGPIVDPAASFAHVSRDGRFVAFQSDASDLVPGDTNSATDVFVRDLLNGTTTRVTVGPGGAQVNGGGHSSFISADGRAVTFLSRATGLVPGDPPCNAPAFCEAVYVHDMATGVTSVVSRGLGGAAANGTAYAPSLSTDGRFVAFPSTASNLVAADTTSFGPNVFVHDRQTAMTTRVNVSTGGAEANGGSYARPSISADGRFVAFSSWASNLVADDTNDACFIDLAGLMNCPDVFVHDRTAGTTTRVNVATGGAQADHGGDAPAITPDGRYVAFMSNSTNLGGGHGFDVGFWHVGKNGTAYIHDRQTGVTTPARIAQAAGLMAGYVSVSDDGRFVSFATTDSAVVSGDSNGAMDVFVWDRASGRIERVSTTEAGAELAEGANSPIISGNGRALTFQSASPALVPGDTNGLVDVFLVNPTDMDGDTLPTSWERAFGMNPTNAADAALDPDADGATNLQEFTAHTHPRGLASATRYFAEGATSTMFETRFSVANPGTTDASVVLRYLKPDGSVSSSVVEVPAMQSRKITASLEPDMATSEFSTVVESDQPIVADRVMWWSADTAYGTSGERAVTAPAARWFLAEGATHSGFNLFYLLQNPAATDAQVRVRYLLPSGAPLVKSYTVAGRSRFNIWVNLEEFPSAPGNALLANTDVSADIEVLSGPDIVVERAMYLTRSAAAPGGLFEAGHESAGVTATASSWYFAEGATGNMFDLFVLVANPSNNEAQVRATYFLDNGTTYTKDYSVAANSRYNIWVDVEQFDGVAGLPLANVSAVATKLEVLNGVPVVAERAMWWPGPTAVTWSEAHNSPGATITATKWVVADGTVQDLPSATDTYYLIANPTDVAALVKVTVLFADGTASVSREYAVAARSRFNVDMRSAFPQSLGKGFGAIVESIGTGTTPIVVEWAIYNDALGKTWAGGANALATPMPEPDGND